MAVSYRRRVAVSGVLLLAILLGSASRLPAAKTWVDGQSGPYKGWKNGANWQEGSQPGVQEVAKFYDVVGYPTILTPVGCGRLSFYGDGWDIRDSGSGHSLR